MHHSAKLAAQSPHPRVVLLPGPECTQYFQHYIIAASNSWETRHFMMKIIIFATSKWNYLPMRDHIYRAFPDDIPRCAFVPLTEHYITKKSQLQHRSYTHVYVTIRITWRSQVQHTFIQWALCTMFIFKTRWAKGEMKRAKEKRQMMTWLLPLK